VGSCPIALIIGWLSVINTAFAFTLWNHTLRTLTAVESSVMNNTVLVQIAGRRPAAGSARPGAETAHS
jgi:drug/metabolite transporter (DMT)-like permease